MRRRLALVLFVLMTGLIAGACGSLPAIPGLPGGESGGGGGAAGGTRNESAKLPFHPRYSSALSASPTPAPPDPAKAWEIRGEQLGFSIDSASDVNVWWSDAGLVLYAKGWVARLNPQDGSVMWTTDLAANLGNALRPELAAAGRGWLLIADHDRSVVLDTETGKVQWEPKGRVRAASPDRVVMEGDPDLVVYEGRTGRELRNLGRSMEVTLSANGKVAVVHGLATRVVEVDTGKELWTAKDDATSSAFHPSGGLVLGSVTGNSVRLMEGGKPTWDQKLGWAPTQVVTLANGDVVALGSGGKVAALKGADGSKLGEVDGRLGTPSISGNPSMGWFLTSEGDRSALVWTEGRDFSAAPMPSGPRHSIPISFNGAYLLGGALYGAPGQNGNGTTQAYDVFTGTPRGQALEGGVVGVAQGLVLTRARKSSNSVITAWGTPPSYTQPPVDVPDLPPLSDGTPPPVATPGAPGAALGEARPMPVRYGPLADNAPGAVAGTPRALWQGEGLQALCVGSTQWSDAGVIQNCSGNVRLADPATGKLRWSKTAGGSVAIVEAANRHVVVLRALGVNAPAVVYDAASGNEVRRHAGTVAAGGSRLALAGADGVTVLDGPGANVVYQQGGAAEDPVLSADGAYLAYRSGSQAVMVDLRGPKELLRAPADGPVALHPHGVVVVDDAGGGVALHNEQGQVWSAKGAFDHVTVLPDGKVAAANSELLVVLDGSTGRPVHQVRAAGRVSVSGVPLLTTSNWPVHRTGSGAWTAVAGDDGTPRAVDLATGKSVPLPFDGSFHMAGEMAYGRRADRKTVAVRLTDGGVAWEAPWPDVMGLAGAGDKQLYASTLLNNTFTAWG